MTKINPNKVLTLPPLVTSNTAIDSERKIHYVDLFLSVSLALFSMNTVRKSILNLSTERNIRPFWHILHSALFTINSTYFLLEAYNHIKHKTPLPATKTFFNNDQFDVKDRYKNFWTFFNFVVLPPGLLTAGTALVINAIDSIKTGSCESSLIEKATVIPDLLLRAAIVSRSCFILYSRISQLIATDYIDEKTQKKQTTRI